MQAGPRPDQLGTEEPAFLGQVPRLKMLQALVMACTHLVEERDANPIGI